jgi:electron transfer flavoprotein alpha subunit
MAKALVWLELQYGKLAPAALEALGKARELAQPGGLQAVLLGSDEAAPLAVEAIEHGADEVFVASASCLEFYQGEGYPQIFAQIAASILPDIIIIGGSSLGMDLAPSVAALLNTGLTSHCVELRVEKTAGKPLLKQIVPGWGGNMLVTIVCPEATPQMATICKGVFAAARRDTSRKGKITKWQLDVSVADGRARTIGVKKNGVANLLAEADIVIAGGFGMLSAGGFRLLVELADVLGAAVAGTRAALDQGWINEDQLLGQSGVAIAPKLLIVVGASGAMHFTSGFKGAQTVIAIDKNPQAPIFASADFGIVGDAAQIIPALIQEITNWNGKPSLKLN